MDNSNSIVTIVGSFGTIVAIVSLIVELHYKIKQEKLRVASMVSVYYRDINKSYDSKIIVINNNSGAVINDVIVSMDIYGESAELGKGDRRCINCAAVPPGNYYLIAPFGGNAAGANFAPSVTFRDNIGVYWTRYSNGTLKKHRKKISVISGTCLPSIRYRQIDSFAARNVIRPISSNYPKAYKDESDVQ